MVWQLAGLLTPDARTACLTARCKTDSAAMEFVVERDTDPAIKECASSLGKNHRMPYFTVIEHKTVRTIW
jgi:hypothetical protein